MDTLVSIQLPIGFRIPPFYIPEMLWYYEFPKQFPFVSTVEVSGKGPPGWHLGVLGGLSQSVSMVSNPYLHTMNGHLEWEQP